MKFSFLLYLSLLFLISSCLAINNPNTAIHNDDPLLVVILMVRDEETVMVRTLEPFVKAGVQSYLIYDTGSIDKTIEVTKDYFKANNIKHAHFFQEPWVYDFSYSRNRSLELAEQQFPNAVFFLIVDAEWEFYNVEGLLNFCRKKKEIKKGDQDYTHSYFIKVVSPFNNETYKSDRLFRAVEKKRYAGKVHEAPLPPAWQEAPSDFYFQQKTERFGYEKSRKRWVRDKEILIKNLLENFNDRDLFYLGQTYQCLGEIEDACKCYKQRSTLKDSWHPEETWMAMYRLANLTALLAESNPNYTWKQAQEYYMQAYTMRPKRAEPLILLAKHYLEEGNYAWAYVYARRSCEIPFPNDEWMSIEKELYDFTRYDILSQCAWYEREYKVGLKAVEKAIEMRPNMLHLYRTLAFLWGDIK